jgi:hypothetical protein
MAYIQRRLIYSNSAKSTIQKVNMISLLNDASMKYQYPSLLSDVSLAKNLNASMYTLFVVSQKGWPCQPLDSESFDHAATDSFFRKLSNFST